MPALDLLLWSRVKTGDKEAFELIFRKYYPVLCLLSNRYTNNMTTAREVVQSLFVYLWENHDQIVVNHSLKSYLYQAVKYNSIRFVEQDRKIGIRMEVFPEAQPDQQFQDHMEYAELQGRILEIIEALPDQCKKVFMLSRFEQLKYAEIAERLSISVKTVESHISKALRILQQNLDNF
jgi:RNA polymerase sigma-70 factor (ECF subfamily)